MEKGREVSNKLNKSLTDLNLKKQIEKQALLKEHKKEIKYWKKELGFVNSEIVKMKNKKKEEHRTVVKTL